MCVLSGCLKINLRTKFMRKFASHELVHDFASEIRLKKKIKIESQSLRETKENLRNKLKVRRNQ